MVKGVVSLCDLVRFGCFISVSSCKVKGVVSL